MKGKIQGKGRRMMSIGFSVVLMAGMLSGCGSSKAPDGYYVINGIKEGNHTVKGDAVEEYGLDGSYVYMEDGEGYIVLLDTPEDLSFDKESGTLKSSFGKIRFSASGKKLTLSDDDVKLEFVKSDDAPPSKPSYPGGGGGSLLSSNNSSGGSGENSYGDFANPGLPDIDWENFDYENYDWENDPDGILAYYSSYFDQDDYGNENGGSTNQDMMDFWNGYWFGYWTLSAWDSDYKKMEGLKFYVLGQTTLDSNGNSEIYLWDVDYSVADVKGTNNGSGLSDLGTFVSESGYFWDGDDLEHAEWRIDPGMEDKDDYIKIEGHCRYKGDLTFDYTIHLVKWGNKWVEFLPMDRPDEYAWYIEQLENGVTDPTKIELPGGH